MKFIEATHYLLEHPYALMESKGGALALGLRYNFRSGEVPVYTFVQALVRSDKKVLWPRNDSGLGGPTFAPEYPLTTLDVLYRDWYPSVEDYRLREHGGDGIP